MPLGKPAGVRCVQLDGDNRCKLFGQPSRPRVCLDFSFDATICASDAATALARLQWLETST